MVLKDNMDNDEISNVDNDRQNKQQTRQQQFVLNEVRKNFTADENNEISSIVTNGKCETVENNLDKDSTDKLSIKRSLLKNNDENFTRKNGISLLKNDKIKTSLESLNETDIRLERGSDERKSNHSGNSSQMTHLDTDHENDLDEMLRCRRDTTHGYDNLQVDSGVESAASSWDRMAEVKEHAFARLQDELKKAHEELKLRDEEVTRLSRIRKEVEAELEDLTASLFQEAHNMVREANMRQAAAEKALKESLMQIEVLTAEVSALKTLVLTSTPSRPNPHLHPQIDPKSKEDTSNCGSGLFRKQHRRSPSHFNLKYGRENSPPDSPTKEQQSSNASENHIDSKELLEVDPVLHKEFLTWKQRPTMEKSDPFIARIYREDINCCLEFNNANLGCEVKQAIENGSICIEAVSDKSKMHFPKKCALLESTRQCHYRMRFGDSETYSISQICRNRITAVCDCLNYLRYIQRGLVKCSVHDMYWEIVRLRKEISLARLGLTSSTSS
ncbi:guanine nucleotide exchange factor for Rab-3A-like isoform X2 [Lycorma delicatula]|uniref:guanine nucleotide exchange factor for Rab-3A-like isoform X2 n=1 Tax=Lycorma delicatula TaxID=130591 RepID=UPI003F50EB83